MLSDIKRFFESSLQTAEETSDSGVKSIEYATAALFIELAKADFSTHASEKDLMMALLEQTFDLDSESLTRLLRQAEQASTEASDLYQFTSLINEHLDNEKKTCLLENFWRLAYADGKLDKYEDQFIRKITGLINLPPSICVKTKLKVKDAWLASEKR